MKLQTLSCPSCGRPSPLSDEDRVTCGACRGVIAIPPEYQQLRAGARDARETRRRAEQRLQAVIDAHWPRSYATLAGVVWVLVAIAAPVCFALTGPWSARAWVVMAGLMPSAIMGFFCVLVISRTLNPALYLATFQRRLMPRLKDEQLCCGSCGAPLAVEAEARAATCDYCHADSWIVAPASLRMSEATERHATNLATLDITSAYRSFEMTVFVWTWWIVWLLTMAALWFLLPGGA